MLFDDSQSLDSGVNANFTYQSGSIAGDIYWEQLTLGSFQIGYQAFSESAMVAGWLVELLINPSLGYARPKSGFDQWQLHWCPWFSLSVNPLL